MKYLYQTLNKKTIVGFTKGLAIGIPFFLLSLASFSQTGVQTDNPVFPAGQDSAGYPLSFYATVKNDAKVVLNWVVAGERPASHFIIQRSADGNDFSDAAVLFTDNNLHPKKFYRYADNISPLDSGVVYYRIKTVGLDGKIVYSGVKMVRIEKKIEGQIVNSPEMNPEKDMLATGYPRSK